MNRAALLDFLSLTYVAECDDGAGARAVFMGTGPNEFLKLRAGPGLGYSVILGLPEGTKLTRRDCVSEIGQRWCRVSLAGATRVTGYVSANYHSAPGSLKSGD